jgi:hypothetical protein
MAAATLYLSRAAVAELDAAQTVIDEHAPNLAGDCPVCRRPAPCQPLTEASAVFARYHQLPRRRPGRALRAAR